MAKRSPQLKLLKAENLSYGGELLKTREGRSHGRPLTTKETIHLVLRSSLAVREWSFKERNNEKSIREIIAKFSTKNGVKIFSMAVVGNHLHIHLKLGNRHAYRRFIRAITSAIAMAITGRNKWTADKIAKVKFWDYRPFTRVVRSLRAVLNLRDYIRVNQLEGYGVHRGDARFLVTRFNELTVADSG